MAFETITWSMIGTAIGGVVGWLFSFLTARHNERTIQIENITKERAKWREIIRDWLTETSVVFYELINNPVLGSRDKQKIYKLRAQLISRINYKDDQYDEEIIRNFDQLFDLQKTKSYREATLKIIHIQISMLLKHDWERVKLECMPFYSKLSYTYRNQHNKINSKNYRAYIYLKR